MFGLIVEVIFAVIVIFALLYVARLFIPIPLRIMQLIYVLVGLAILVWVVSALGVFGDHLVFSHPVR